MNNPSENMDEMRRDVLKEIANIGSGHAATSLSALLGRPIEQSVPNILLVPLTDIPGLLGGAEQVVLAGMLGIRGDFAGYFLMILELGQAERIISMVTGNKPRHAEKLSLQRFSALDRSVLSETLNIMGGSYLAAISDFTGLNVHSSVPSLCVDMVGSILSIVAAEMGKTGDYAVLFGTELFNQEERIIGNLFLLPDGNTCDTMLESLGFI